MSPAFWTTPALRDALAAQHIGRVARAYRRHSEFAACYGRNGVSQQLLGTWVGFAQAQVSRIENGPPTRNLDTLALFQPLSNCRAMTTRWIWLVPS